MPSAEEVRALSHSKSVLINLILLIPGGSAQKIFEDQQISEKSILQSWYTHTSISPDHGSDKKQKSNSGDGHTAESAKFHQ